MPTELVTLLYTIIDEKLAAADELPAAVKRSLKEVLGALKYTITVESDVPPKIFLGADIGGATVVSMQQLKVELVSASYIAQRHRISVATVRRRLSTINQGTVGKFLYDPVKASQLLKDSKSKRGRKGAC